MKKTLFLIICGFLIISGCQTQTKKSNFGTYYKIDKYNIEIPFAGQPHISPKQDNGVLTYVSYQYAFPRPEDDINLLYGIDICELKIDTMFKNQNLKIEYIAGMFKLTYEKIFNGTLIKEESTDYHGSYGYKQKIKVSIPNVGDVYVQSLLLPYKDIVIRMYSFTPIANEDNQKISDFFDSIKLK